MFTGIIKNIGKIELVNKTRGGMSFKISIPKLIDQIYIDDSVCVNGVCLTVTKKSGNCFFCDAVGSTIDKTTLKYFKKGHNVNLELSLKINDRLGGHIVLGHVNGFGLISNIKKVNKNYMLQINIPTDFQKYLVPEGSITIDGVSLTISKVYDDNLDISIIPHTWKNTTFKEAKIGDKVNIEIDILAKYIENFSKHYNSKNTLSSIEQIHKLGFN